MRIPSLRRHASGVGTARLAGHDYYFGPWPDPALPAPPAVEKRYREAVARWLAGGPGGFARAGEAPGLIVADLIDRYLDYLREDCPAGSREPVQVELATRPLRELYGLTPAAAFDAGALELVRGDMVRGKEWVRSHANKCTARCKRLFRWAGRQKLVPSAVYADLCTLEPLRVGQRGVRERTKRRPATAADVEAVASHLTAPMGAMLRLLWLTGMRPGEVRRLSGAEIDRAGDVWVYRPGSHKGSWKEQSRAVALGPAAQLLLTAWLELAGGGPVFGPRRLVWAYREAVVRRAAGLAPAEADRFALTWFKRVPGRAFLRAGDFYTASGFESSVRVAAGKAGLPWFSSYSTRHGFKMLVASAFGPEATKAAMGHASIDTQSLYGEHDLEAAKAVARKVG